MLTIGNSVTDYVLVTGDGDFSVLIQKLRQKNKNVLGISQNINSTSSILISSCDEFIILEELKKYEDEKQTLNSQKQTLRLELRNSIESLLECNEFIYVATLKEKLLRLNPQFSERNFGFKKFGALIRNLDYIQTEYRNNGRDKDSLSVKAPVLSINKASLIP